MVKRKVTVVTEGTWQYSGFIVKEKYSPLGSLEWLEVESKNRLVKIHARYIISIIHHKSS